MHWGGGRDFWQKRRFGEEHIFCVGRTDRSGRKICDDIYFRGSFDRFLKWGGKSDDAEFNLKKSRRDQKRAGKDWTGLLWPLHSLLFGEGENLIAPPSKALR